MKVLGIDPGSRTAGYGLIKSDRKKIIYLDSGILKFDHISNFLERVKFIYESFSELVFKIKPDVVVLESLIYVKSVPALAKLAQARGAIISGCSSHEKAELYEYSPNLIKSSVSGFGHADKVSIEKAVTLILGKKTFKKHDETDALAIAICHVLNAGSHGKFTAENKNKRKWDLIGSSSIFK